MKDPSSCLSLGRRRQLASQDKAMSARDLARLSGDTLSEGAILEREREALKPMRILPAWELLSPLFHISWEGGVGVIEIGGSEVSKFGKVMFKVVNSYLISTLAKRKVSGP